MTIRERNSVGKSTITAMFSVNQTRGKRSIAQLTDHELPKTVTATLEDRTLDNTSKSKQSCTQKKPGKPLCSQLFHFKSTDVQESNTD